MRDRLAHARTLLFVPGDRPDRFSRALASGADAVVVDLEDAVHPRNKTHARAEVVSMLMSMPTDATPVVVRINDPRNDFGVADLAALSRLEQPVAAMVPKCDSASVVDTVIEALGTSGLILPLIETSSGVHHVRSIAAAQAVVRLVFGHLDFCAELGLDPGDSSRLWPARFALITASAAAGLPAPVDGVSTEITDLAAIRDATAEALVGGFTGKLCIHPAQVAVVNQGFAPTDEELDWAHRVLEALNEHDVGVVDGDMVDRPVWLRANAVVARAGNSAPAASGP
ncbi:MAG: citrate lyase [Nocardioides sp.]|nr:citrate lyase [Nocardioides sp.]